MAITHNTEHSFDELFSLLEEHSKAAAPGKFEALTESGLADHQTRCDRIIQLLDQLTSPSITALN